MKNSILAFFICLLTSGPAMAQNGQLIVKNSEKGLYLEHTVTAKEGFYSIGRLYNVHPKFIAAYNNLDINGGISIGQVINIPLTDTNFSQKINKGTAIYYAVGEKEGLMRVSNLHNKVKLQNLRTWNKLADDNIKMGSLLIVGFLTGAEYKPPVATVASTPKEEPKKAEDKAVVTKPDSANGKPVAKTEPVVTKQEPKEEPKKTEPAASNTVATENNATGQGYFRTFFEYQAKQRPASKNETVTSGIFKTTHGLQEAKYYLLMDKVAPGTIVRISNPDNNKVIYAKVLGEMSGIRQNKGLDIRLCDSAAAVLGVTETDKFIVKVNY